MITLNKKQIDMLRGLWLHQGSVTHEHEKPDFKFYADQLDNLKVPFWLQNAIAYEAASREAFYGKYFSTILQTVNR